LIRLKLPKHFIADVNGVVTKYSITSNPAVVYDPATNPDVVGPSFLFSGGTVAEF